MLHGWQPQGTTEPDQVLDDEAEDGMRWEPSTYFLPRGQRIEQGDARELARCSGEALADVSDTLVPLGGGPFGRRNTVVLIRLAAEGQSIPPRRVEVAAQIVSGPPKVDALALVEFLAAGPITIHPGEEP